MTNRAPRDDNYIPVLMGVSSSDGVTPVTIYVDPTTHRVLVSGSADPGGNDTEVQFNDGGIIAGDPGMTYNKTTNVLTVGGLVVGTLTGILRADSGVVSVDTDVTDLVKQRAQFMLFEADVSVSTGDGVGGFAVPAVMNGLNLTAALGAVHTKGITGTTDIVIRRRRAGSDVDMLSTPITIGDEWFAADGVINGANDDLATGDIIYCDVDAVHSGTAPLGLSVALTFS